MTTTTTAAGRTAAAREASLKARKDRKERRQAEELRAAGWVCLSPKSITVWEATKYVDHVYITVTAVEPVRE